jgi:hypothetical protein
VEALGLNSFEEFQVAALDTLKCVPAKMLRRCYNTYSQRLRKFIKAGEGKIKH